MFGHRYFGPGNSVEPYDDPIDDDDVIALLHDWEYIRARSASDIAKADVNAVNDFIDLWHKRGNWHALFGGISLFVKQQYEQVFGKVYPLMDKTTHRGHRLYAERMRNLAANYKRDRDTFDGNWNEYIRQHGKRNRGTTSTTTTTTGRPVENTLDDSLGLDDLDWDTIDSQIVAPGHSQSGSHMSMDIPLENYSAGGTGGMGPNNTVGPDMSTPCDRMYTQNNDIFIEKYRTQYSYGFANSVFFSHDTEDATRTTLVGTPMALIPVDFIPFYMTEAEWEQLPTGSFVKYVICSVKYAGMRTSFDVGSTLTGVANSEHVGILFSSIGLNLHTFGRNYQFTTSPEKPMIPTGVKQLAVKDFLDKWYNNWQSTCMGIPRSLAGYWTIQVNDTENKTAEYPLNVHGIHHLSKYVKRHYANKFGQLPIVQYTYQPKFAPLKTKDYSTQWGATSSTVEIPVIGTSAVRSYNIQQPATDDKDVLSDTLPTKMYKKYNIGEGKIKYESSIEKIGFNLHTGNLRNNIAQPQLHVGLAAIPQLNPSADSTAFQTSAAYFDISTKICIGVQWGSNKCNNEAYADYDEVCAFVPSQQYVTGMTYAGWNDDGVGSLTKPLPQKRPPAKPVTRPIVRDDDDISIISQGSASSSIVDKYKGMKIK